MREDALPARAHCKPERAAQHESNGDKRGYGRREHRIHHERQARDELRPSVLFLAIHEQHETEPAWNEREKEPRGIKRHARLAFSKGDYPYEAPGYKRFRAVVKMGSYNRSKIRHAINKPIIPDPCEDIRIC